MAEQLAVMIGYPARRSWGHLTSGGTVANFEALWIARNIQYFPLAAAGAAAELGVDVEVGLPDGSTSWVGGLGLAELLNIRNDAAMDLWEAGSGPWRPGRTWLARSTGTPSQPRDTAIHRRLVAAFTDPLPDSVVLVAATAHYSWEKIVRALGIGSNQLVYVPVDQRYRMHPDGLWDVLQRLAGQQVPVMGLISVCGTTEESAVDRLDLVLEVRARAERELGMTFHVHSDACYGGYAAAVTRRADGSRRRAAEIRASTGTDWPSDEWVKAIGALEGADSVTIDPHKLGYVPYPAGAILVRDRRARELVAVDPPYLLPAEDIRPSEETFDRPIHPRRLEAGRVRRSGLAQPQGGPPDERGYGYLIERTVIGARKLHAALRNARLDPFRVIVLPEPDINLVCYLVYHPGRHSLAGVNALNEHIYQQMSMLRPDDSPEYIITRTRFQSPMYDGAVDPLLDDLGVASAEEWRASGAQGLVVLRSTVMDPYLSSPAQDGQLAGFLAALGRASETALAATTALATAPPASTTR